MNLKQFNAHKLQFAVAVLEGIMQNPKASSPLDTPRIIDLVVDQFQKIGVGAGHA